MYVFFLIFPNSTAREIVQNGKIQKDGKLVEPGSNFEGLRGEINPVEY